MIGCALQSSISSSEVTHPRGAVGSPMVIPSLSESHWMLAHPTASQSRSYSIRLLAAGHRSMAVEIDMPLSAFPGTMHCYGLADANVRALQGIHHGYSSKEAGLCR